MTGRNFGSGSSREHAPWALQDFGFQAIIAPSFADIFYVNCTKIGLLPVVLDRGAVPRRRRGRRRPHRPRRPDRRPSAAGVVKFEIEPEIKHRLLNGLDDIGITLESVAAIDEFEAAGGADHGPVTTAL